MTDSHILLDTDILIDVSRQVKPAIRFVEQCRESHTISISVITQLELRAGCSNKKEFSHLLDFLSRFEIIPISEIISIKTVELFEMYRLSHGVQLPDMFIAATALVHDVTLSSKNKKDFIFIDELDFEPYEVT